MTSRNLFIKTSPSASFLESELKIEQNVVEISGNAKQIMQGDISIENSVEEEKEKE